jgi:hypothetical protein
MRNVGKIRISLGESCPRKEKLLGLPDACAKERPRAPLTDQFRAATMGHWPPRRGQMVMSGLPPKAAIAIPSSCPLCAINEHRALSSALLARAAMGAKVRSGVIVSCRNAARRRLLRRPRRDCLARTLPVHPAPVCRARRERARYGMANPITILIPGIFR